MNLVAPSTVRIWIISQEPFEDRPKVIKLNKDTTYWETKQGGGGSITSLDFGGLGYYFFYIVALRTEPENKKTCMITRFDLESVMFIQ